MSQPLTFALDDGEEHEGHRTNRKWIVHRDLMRRLWVDENMNLDQIVEYMREHHNFTPGRRSFQGAFNRWKFPSKARPHAWKNEALVARVRELWENNASHGEMMRVLVERDGYDILDKDLRTLRSRHGFLLHQLGGYVRPKHTKAAKRRRELAAREGRSSQSRSDSESGSSGNEDEEDGEGEDEEAEKRRREEEQRDLQQLQQLHQHNTAEEIKQAEKERRKRQMEIENQERLRTKKRRRHTVARGFLPPDPPGMPPRYPSETTLTEAKQYLQIEDHASYMALREKFMAICNAHGVTKKTICGPEKWEQVKNQLIRESMHLRAVMWDPENMGKKKLAIEVIANDVTKRIRTMNSALTLPQAKQILGLNPLQGGEVRAALYKLLAEENFGPKWEEGMDRYQELKKKWIMSHPALKAVMDGEGIDPAYPQKIRAINLLARDASRRYHEEVVRKGKDPFAPRSPTPEPKPKPPPKPRKVKAPPPPKPAPVPSEAAPGDTGDPPAKKRRGRPPKNPAPAASGHTGARFMPPPDDNGDDDQGLLDAQLGADVAQTIEDDHPFIDEQYIQGYQAAQQALAHAYTEACPGNGLATFIRLHSATRVLFPNCPRQWIHVLEDKTYAELKKAATAKTPNAICYAIEGIVKDGKGGELDLPVTDDMELEIYLEHVQGKGAPIFNVHLVAEEWPPKL
ncbi:hypothetical protein QBC35DRAFT_374926 [Podospora australis]|uniref:Clr5 domain-containing protein n=1 Tax=Podospora australis TaxID=1536484 RepID=A0AAN6X0Z2_9PEZI|nr:hypothetical protein QBC35DRAFT_374926 [Podospora australis]